MREAALSEHDGHRRRPSAKARRVASNRLSRTPQPLAGHPRRGGLRKGCFALRALKKCVGDQCVECGETQAGRQTFAAMGNAAKRGLGSARKSEKLAKFVSPTSWMIFLR